MHHVLDEESPLLSSHAKKLLAKNKGSWPKELCSYRAIREHIDFREIFVSLSGTDSVTGRTVYYQKVYDVCDLNIGYKFAKVLYRDRFGRVTVDIEPISDIVEQDGGGGEPLRGVGMNLHLEQENDFEADETRTPGAVL